jgi:hypothetical protein
MGKHRCAPPWDIEDNGSCFIIRDNNGQALSYVYYANELGRRTAAGLLTATMAHRHQCRQPAGAVKAAAVLDAPLTNVVSVTERAPFHFRFLDGYVYPCIRGCRFTAKPFSHAPHC